MECNAIKGLIDPTIGLIEQKLAISNEWQASKRAKSDPHQSDPLSSPSSHSQPQKVKRLAWHPNSGISGGAGGSKGVVGA